MRRYFNEAARRKVVAMWLIVWKQNIRALDFYRKWNFEVIGESEFQLGSVKHTD